MGQSRHIVACIPFARETVYVQFFISWSKMFAFSRGKYDLSMASIYGPYIDANRDALIQEALKMDADYVLFLDDDQTYPYNTVDILLNYDKDIVGGITPRKETGTPMIWDYDGQVKIWDSLKGKKGLTKIDGMGMGGVLINSKVFDKLEYPYFKRHTDATYQGCGEDISFYLKCKQAGIEVWADIDLQYGHLGVGEKTFAG